MAPNFKKNFEKSPNFAKYIIFGTKTDKKTHFGAIWNFSHLYVNPLWTIGHICHTIFGPRHRCAYLQIAHERLKTWKKVPWTKCITNQRVNYKSKIQFLKIFFKFQKMIFKNIQMVFKMNYLDFKFSANWCVLHYISVE